MRDESHVSVGGLLALNQFLRKHWSRLTTFWTTTGWSKMERLGGAEITRSHLFCGPNKRFIRVYVMDYGMSAHGVTHD
jgi:hypothetical protein